MSGGMATESPETNAGTPTSKDLVFPKICSHSFQGIPSNSALMIDIVIKT